MRQAVPPVDRYTSVPCSTSWDGPLVHVSVWVGPLAWRPAAQREDRVVRTRCMDLYGSMGMQYGTAVRICSADPQQGSTVPTCSTDPFVGRCTGDICAARPGYDDLLMGGCLAAGWR